MSVIPKLATVPLKTEPENRSLALAERQLAAAVAEVKDLERRTINARVRLSEAKRELMRLATSLMGDTRNDYRGPRMAGMSDLSPRQAQIFSELLERKTNKEIAAVLNIAERTVKFHVSLLLHKFGVATRVELLLMKGRVYGRRRA